MHGKEILIAGHAKINLYLDIVGKREDGYHYLENFAQSIDLCDFVRVRLIDEGVKITAADRRGYRRNPPDFNPMFPTDERNICFKTAKVFEKYLGEPVCAEFEIDKNIPVGAGLGGESADAAAALFGLGAVYNWPLTSEQLTEAANEIGSDVSFCLNGGFCHCWGTGDRFERLDPLPWRWYLLVMPKYQFSTVEAYANYDKNPVPPMNKAEEFAKNTREFPRYLYNVFENVHNDKGVGRIKEIMLENGAEGAGMTGSGSMVYGIFSDELEACRVGRIFPDTVYKRIAYPVALGTQWYRT